MTSSELIHLCSRVQEQRGAVPLALLYKAQRKLEAERGLNAQ